MSSFPSGGSRAYGIDLDAVLKSSSCSPATSTRSTNSSSSSPSSTFSESRNHPLAISTKRPRAPRKRPNQAYDEAATLLATAYPSVFSAKGLLELCKKNASPFYAEPTAELLPTRPVLGDAAFLLHQYFPDEQRLLLEPARPTSSSERSWACPSPASTEFQEPSSPARLGDGFDVDSILDEELGEGIDSIMGNLDMNSNSTSSSDQASPYLWNPMAYGHGGCGGNMRRALRRGAEDGEWWRCRTVEVLEITPELNPPPPPPPHPPSTNKKEKKKNKKEKRKKVEVEGKTEKSELALGLAASSSPTQLQWAVDNKAGLGLNLDYEEVLKAWSGRGSPFSDAGDSSGSPVGAIVERSQIDLLPDEAATATATATAGGGVREASMMRHREKRRSVVFSRRMRYEVWKLNEERRPRLKANGRFVRRRLLSFLTGDLGIIEG